MSTQWFINTAIANIWKPHSYYNNPLEITVDKLNPAAVKALGINLGVIEEDYSNHNSFLYNHLTTRFTKDGRCKIKIYDPDGIVLITIVDTKSAKELKAKLLDKYQQDNTPQFGDAGGPPW